ncbi:bifunctional RNase H/acid phosphatase [Nonomuraea coxensis DSM 45129]|uniref:Bifunctional RNase H/acid phosphatase n=1 Tax=Nonomuraea coxensis DSM 45129 TaxID=1122611 RepID=A0ABX8U363_9ACTN|nr:histidine phosphatase family protein [Nonomuraea coxensis]QYC42186.1 bifunctional RNase H/acid phosphatase [Nonomuraea coxensis DSM 45129]
MTERLVLIAHAPTSATHGAGFAADESLTPSGRSSAEAARGRLRRIRQALRGPETRCEETCAALGLTAGAGEELRDLDVGSWRGRSLEQVQAEDPAGLLAWLTDPGASPHGGETINGMLERVAGWMDAWPHEPGRVAVITHPAVIRAVVLRVLCAPATAFWNLDVPPLSQTWLSWNGGKWRLRETGHPLAGEGADLADR